jgi:hypothetical protein
MVDGTDMLDAAHLNLPGELLTDMVPYLNRRCGKYRLYDIYFAQNTGAFSSYASLTGVNTTVYATMTGATALFGFATDPHSPILGTSDALFVTYVGGVLAAATAGSPIPSIALGYQANGAGAYTADTPSQQPFVPPSATPVSVTALFFAGGPRERFDIALMTALATAGGTANVFAQTPYRITAFHYRQN